MEILVDARRLADRAWDGEGIGVDNVDFSSDVQSGQIVARCVSPAGLRAGENVAVRVEEGRELFVATTAGTLQVDGSEIRVVKVLHIAGNVTYRTGHLDFAGEIRVAGGVTPGVSVQASHDVIVAGEVGAGATVTAGGDLVVGGGIVGRRTRVEAGGRVWAGWVEEGTVTAGTDLFLEDHSYQGRLRAGGGVTIGRGVSRRGGSAVGGWAWASEGIDAYLAGSPAHIATLLVAGVDPDEALQLDRLKEQIDLVYRQVKQLLDSFKMKTVDVEQIRNMIAAAAGPRRKMLAVKAKKLGQVVQKYQELVAACKELEEEIRNQAQEAEIKLHERAFPGVEVRLKGHRHKLSEERKSPRFFVADGKIAEVEFRQQREPEEVS